ncbi:MAG: RagB/SusD family nutrient uptake outer membrane protein [Candidatus Pedobacter colombiensis]|uniref:RagB/SusD family nutrient uptake outer membrane protein n=1 Tax=Candidatus Pedobacter colombiensis TaxID=3121371 RepID=A0AAJ5WCI3_9SPHI|nr:RagB/SusD family nutrient uptake outer membrane protein [Pedobacter sp.]WEK20187.1 MAG: RagB/SusD family nutrient uptake outer membrane protein [Pedobacter sp.]
MKKISKLVYISFVLTCFLVLPTSCKKSFLDENMITAKNTQDFEKPDGLDGLVIGMYQSLRFHFNYEWAYSTTNYGTDEFTVGGDRTEQMWNSYDANLNSLNGDVSSVWDNMYGNINSANIVIQNIPLFYGNGANKNTRLGEGYFMRAFDYFKLVKQYGGVPLKLTPSTTVELEFTRTSAKETYEQVIQDFIQAYNLLPAAAAEPGRITKWAAAHFLAKAYLFRASELNNDWNGDTKTADLNNAIKYADLVINSSGCILATDFKDLWNFTAVNGPNENNKEIILAAQFSDNVATQGRYGNQVHLYYPSVYQTLPGMVRDIPGDREFQRLRSTDYALDIYDRVNDSRFWKSFKTTYLCNNPNGAPLWTAVTAPSPDLVGKPKFAGGEESIRYIVNNAGDSRYTAANITMRAPSMYVRYFNGQAQNMLGGHGNYGLSQYVALSKFMDGSRNLVAAQPGQRDGILARLAETYLIAAEAYGRLGQFGSAIPYLNKVRDRAAYKEGEDRAAYVDGGIAYKNNPVANTAKFVSYSDKNSYFESNNLATTTATTLSSMHLNSENDIFNSNKEFYDKVGATSQLDKFVSFILNERSRELMGELMRWEDLARTKTLVARATAFNDEAKPLANKHYLRPLPQLFLDVIYKNNQPLTPAEKAAIQNPNW